MPVHYSTLTLSKRFVGRSGGLQFRTSGRRDEAIDALRDAWLAWMPKDERDPVDHAPSLVCTSVGPGEGGPVLYVSHCDSRVLLEGLLAALAANLEAAGWSGRLMAAPFFEAPRVFAPAISLAATLKLEWDLVKLHNDPVTNEWRSAWWVSSERTARVLAPMVEWVLAGRGDVFAHVATSAMPVERDAALATVLHAMRGPFSTGSVTLAAHDSQTGGARQLALYNFGQVIVQEWAPDRSWSEALRALVDMGDGIWGDINNAFANITPSDRSSRYEAFEWPPIAMSLTPSMFHVSHLECEYLLDAHGFQVVTARHLDRLGPLDLGRWTVVDLGDDRHSITHHDLAAWFDVDPRPYAEGDTIRDRPVAPPEDVLKQARQDFCPVLMTSSIVDTQPFPPDD